MASAAAVVPAPEQLVARVQELQERLDACTDATTRDLAEELVAAVVQMYGAGLERLMDVVMTAGPERERIVAGLAGDDLVSTLLLIHDLHPVSLAERVQAALVKVRPYMESHGGGVELLSLEAGVARIHLRGSCSDCSASSVTLELAIKQALEEAAPDLEGLEVEGVAPQITGLPVPMTGANGGSGYELPMVMATPASAPVPEPVAPSWFDLDPGDEPAEGSMSAVQIGGERLVIANVEGTLLAYRDACAHCGETLRSGELVAGALHCPHCARAFFLPRAGRSMDGERLQLTPIPLLRERGSVKVALAS